MATQPNLDIQLSPNYTEGRQGTPVRRIAFHHVVGTAASAVMKFKSTGSQTSSHFVVASNKIYCCVDTDNTAWTNGNWASNLESVTIEHEGDWRFGYRNEGVIAQSAILVAWLRTLYPNATPIRHRDVSPTACPGDLPVEEIWNRATAILNPPKPPEPVVPPATAIQITDIQNRKVWLKKDANLWDLNFNTWAEARSVKVIPKYQPDGSRTEVEVSATAKHPLGSNYYMTEYSLGAGIKNGINVVDCEEIPVVAPPVVVEPPVVTPPVVIPPIVEPEYPNWFVSFWMKIIDAIKGILGKK